MANRENSNMYKGRYEWIIKGNKLTQMIKADNGQKFTSQTFKMWSLDWCIEAYPNGDRDNNVGSFKVFLKLLSLPSFTVGLIIYQRIYCKELFSTHTNITPYNYKKDDSKGLADYTLSLNEVRNKNMTQISFIIEIKIPIMDCIANCIGILREEKDSSLKHIVNNGEHYNDIIAKLNYPFICCWIVSDGIIDAESYDLRFNLYLKHKYPNYKIANLYQYKFHTTHKQIKYLHHHAYTGKDSRFHLAQMAFPRPTDPQRIQRKHRGLNQQMRLMDDLLMIKPDIQTIASFDNQIDGNYECTSPGRKYSRARFWNSEQKKATQRDNDALSHFLCQLLNSASFAVKSKELFAKCNINNCVSQIIKLKATSMLQILRALAVENIFYDKDRHLHEKLLTDKWKYVRFHTLSVATRPAHGNKLSFIDHWALKFEGVQWLLTVEWFGSATFFVKFLPNNCLGQKVFWFSWTKKSTQTFTQRWGSLKKINISQGITAENICKLLNKWLVFGDGQEYKSKYDQMRNNCQHFVRDFVCFLNKKIGEELTKEFHHRRVEKIMTPFGASSDDCDQYLRMDKVRKLLVTGKELLTAWQIPAVDEVLENLRDDGFEDPADWQDIYQDDDYLINHIGLKRVHCNKFKRKYKQWLL